MPEDAPIILLDGPSTSPEALYIQAALESAYQSLGYRVKYQKIPLARSFVEADAGRIDGLRARVGDVEKEFVNLIKIPVPLFEFEMVMLADRRKCGVCDYQWIEQVAVARGFRAFEYFQSKQSNPVKPIYVTHAQQAFNMVMEGKVSGAVMSGASVPKVYSAMSHHWIKTTLARLADYHFVHRKHEHLVPKLTQVLRQMQTSGELENLKRKFGMQQYYNVDQHTDFGVIKAVSASWHSFSDTPEATYFKILNTVYQGHSSGLDVNIVNWKRAKQTFYDGKADILVGAYDFEVDQRAIRSDIHLDYELPVTAFAKNDSDLKDWLSGSTKGTACYLLGYDFNSVLPESISSYEAPSIADCLRLLKAGRVDILLDYEIDLSPDFVVAHAKQQVLEGFPLFMVFQDTERGRQLRHYFEIRYRQLILDGKLEAIFPSKIDYRNANFVPKNYQKPQ
ncbi:hypothetical protein GCM10009114_34010 [Aliiglaciecola litoralis]|uniref:Solute-binding protein family 3/N-terminal domain-containing protein n=1 Tax=Aliiglaciecola litoralis TaxID=582857 RepID=A0ABN1LSK9_9ALTE